MFFTSLAGSSFSPSRNHSRLFIDQFHFLSLVTVLEEEFLGDNYFEGMVFWHLLNHKEQCPFAEFLTQLLKLLYLLIIVLRDLINEIPLDKVDVALPTIKTMHWYLSYPFSLMQSNSLPAACQRVHPIHLCHNVLSPIFQLFNKSLNKDLLVPMPYERWITVKTIVDSHTNRYVL